MNQPLRDLLDLTRFTAGVSAKIYGLLDEAEIYKTVRREFNRSKRYSATITSLTDGGTGLRVVETSLSLRKLKAAESLAGIGIEEYEVVREGKTVQTSAGDLMDELFQGSIVHSLLKTLDYEKSRSILTPLRRHGKIVGVLGVSFSTPTEHFVPSVEHLAQHMSTALELAGEHAERKQAEEGHGQALAQALQATRALQESEARYHSLFERVPGRKSGGRRSWRETASCTTLKCRCTAATANSSGCAIGAVPSGTPTARCCTMKAAWRTLANAGRRSCPSARG
jgi:hypothetical protein